MKNNPKELYVGSLSYDATEYDLEKLFSVSGTVTSIHLIVDLKTGEFKGCGYVRMSSEAEAKDAIASLDGAMLIDRRITVSLANPVKTKTTAGGYKGKSGGAAPGKSPVRSAVGSKSASPKSAAAKPAASKSAAAKPAAAKPGFAKPASAKPGFAKSDSPKSGFAKSDSPEKSFSRSDSPKTEFSKPDASKTGFSKPGASRTGFSKPGAPKSGGSRTGKR